MTVTNVDKNTETRTLTITSRLEAPIERVWKIWSDPRQLERWWGPPTYPATFVDHELTVGATTVYFLTGPEGDEHHDWWEITAGGEPRSLEIEDAFVDEHGNPDPQIPGDGMTIRVTLSEDAGATNMEIRTSFPTDEIMEKMIAMGMAEGMTEALGQVDALLAG
jgi:uncharacterized protein YndB with AHSA1/START domain